MQRRKITFCQRIVDALEERERMIVGLSIFGGYSGKELAQYFHKKEGNDPVDQKPRTRKIKAGMGMQK